MGMGTGMGGGVKDGVQLARALNDLEVELLTAQQKRKKAEASILLLIVFKFSSYSHENITSPIFDRR